MEAIGKLTNGENVFMRRTGKNSYQYVDGNGNKVDGRKVKKFSKKTTNKGATSVEAEKMKKKATPKPSVKKTNTKGTEALKKIESEDIIKKKIRDDNLDKKEKMYMEYEKKQLNGQKPTFTSKAKMKKDFNKIWLKEKKATPEPTELIGGYEDEDGKTQTAYLSKPKKGDWEKIEYPKEDDSGYINIYIPKQGKHQGQPKQTTDQLAKRRLKYQENRAKELARKRAYREANKEKINQKQDAYRETAKSKAYQKAYREAHSKNIEV